MSIIRQNKTFLSIMTCAFLILCAFFITRQYTVKAEDGLPDGSFATMSQAAAQYLNNRLSKVGGENSGTELPENFGNMAGLIGYVDPNSSGTGVQTFAATNTNGNTVWDFNGIDPNDDEKSLNDVPLKYFAQYCRFGYMLNQAGLDQTNFNGMPGSYRQVIGIVLSGAYVMSQAVDVFWGMVLGILELANPFRLINDASIKSKDLGIGLDNMSNISDGYDISTAINAGMDQVADVFSNFYATLQQFAIWTTLPLIICLSLFIWLVVRQGREGGRTFKNVIIRMAFAFIGVPLMLSCYTTVLHLVKDAYIGVGNVSLSTRIIESTFFDFERFVYGVGDGNTGEALYINPNNTNMTRLSYDLKNDTLSTEVYLLIRDICYKASRGITGGVTSTYNSETLPGLEMSDSTNGFSDWDAWVLARQMDNSGGGSGSVELTKGYKDEIPNVLHLLERYAKGDKVSAGTYEAYRKQAVVAKETISTNAFQKGLIVLYGLSDSWEEFDDKLITDFEVFTAGTQSIKIDSDKAAEFAKTRFSGKDHNGAYSTTFTIAGITGPNLWADGGMTISASSPGDCMAFVAEGSALEKGYAKNGLSSIGMYNYLSSSFERDKITVYSAKNTSGMTSKAEHYAVNVVGTNLMQVIFVLNDLVLLVVVAVIGYGYGLSILVGNIKAMFKMVPAVLSGVIGSMRGIASAIILIAALIIEILGTCILYSLAMSMIQWSVDLFERPVAILIAKVAERLKIQNAYGILVPLYGILSVVVLAVVCKKLLQYRYAVCQSVTEATAGIINKFLGTNVAAPELGKPPASFGQAAGYAALAAGGVAMAAGSNGSSGSIGERLGLSKSGEESSGNRGETDESTSSSSSSSSNGLGVKGGESDPNYNGSDIESNNINSDADAEKYVEDNKDAIENLDKNGSTTSTDTQNITDSTDTTSNAETNVDAETTDSQNKTSNSTTTETSENNEESDEQNNKSSTKTVTGTSETNEETDVNGMVDGKAGSGAVYTVTGEDGEQYQLVNAKTGERYTAADKENGETYSLVNSKGEVYTDANGNTYSGMKADTLSDTIKNNVGTFSTTNGSISGTSSLSPTPAAAIAPSGYTPGNYGQYTPGHYGQVPTGTSDGSGNGSGSSSSGASNNVVLGGSFYPGPGGYGTGGGNPIDAPNVYHYTEGGTTVHNDGGSVHGGGDGSFGNRDSGTTVVHDGNGTSTVQTTQIQSQTIQSAPSGGETVTNSVINGSSPVVQVNASAGDTIVSNGGAGGGTTFVESGVAPAGMVDVNLSGFGGNGSTSNINVENVTNDVINNDSYMSSNSDAIYNMESNANITANANSKQNDVSDNSGDDSSNSFFNTVGVKVATAVKMAALGVSMMNKDNKNAGKPPKPPKNNSK